MTNSSLETETRARKRTRSVAGTDPVLTIGKIFAWGSALICLLPLPLVFAVATSSNWVSGPWVDGFTFTWLADGWSRISSNFGYSLRVALIVLFLDLAISLPAAWLLARRQFIGRGIAMAITTMPIAIPGIALAIGLILSYPVM